MSSRIQFRKNIGTVGPIGEPFLNGVPEFNGNFTIPFALCDKDEYLIWLFHLAGSLRTHYGPDIMIRNLAKSVIRITLAFGTCMVYNQKYCDFELGPLDCFRKFHQNFCKYELADDEEWFSNWAVIMTKLRAEGKIEVYNFSREINGFTDEELELFDNMASGLYDKKGLIRRYLQGTDSGVIDISDRASAFISKHGEPRLHQKAVELSWFLSKPLSEAVGPE
ncbi:hypothetical protein CA3LBN_001863 [Candidozyma haemuli]|uniref:Uncharacterized protein n=1 Tax=Candidozyma haemuli TaxID=45357 RepID=A0ABX8I8P0_9ASCO|nr:hypothetical protein CA3LBN_001863 [[Candida] haemuloni]